MQRSTVDKLAIYKTCFSGIMHAHGTYDPITGRVAAIRQPVTDEVLLRHLRGVQPYGVYLLNTDARTRAVVADFDHDDPVPVLAFIEQAAAYDLRPYVERSKSKGWHVWVFFPPEGVPAFKARLVLKAVLDDIGEPKTEVFPKQDRLANGQLGNFINAPLWGRAVPHGRTVFVNPRGHLRPYGDQWELLASVDRVTEHRLDEIVEINDLGPTTAVPPIVGTIPAPKCYGLPACAQRMLAEGVHENQRLACFRLAVHLRRTGLSLDLTIATLHAWALKNRPRDGRRIITPDEIAAQAASAYSQFYRGCGCDDPVVAPYCDPACPVAKRRRWPW